MSDDKNTPAQDELWPDGQGPVRLMPEPEDEGAPLIVDLDGFEGPLDLLLQLARNQKVDTPGFPSWRWPNSILCSLKTPAG